MTPHEVIQNSLEQILQKSTEFYVGSGSDLTVNTKHVVDVLKSSQLSLLLSVKEMVDKQSLQSYSSREVEIGFEFCREAVKSLLDTEINKIKEI